MANIEIQKACVDFPVFDFRTNSLRVNLLSKVMPKTFKLETTIQNVRALDEINLIAQEGDSIGIFGHNGSGKSSLLRLIAGIYQPSTGTIKTTGKVRPLLTIGCGVEPSLSGKENIIRLGLLNGFPLEEIEELKDEIINFSGLGNFIDMPIRTYSSGMTMRLLFSVLTSKSTDILVMDEFFSTGDEEFLVKSRGRIENLLEDSKILVFASNSRELLKTYCNRFIIMNRGIAEEIEPTLF